ncbi:hypothetical protein CPC08DRAFT_730157 [Agrocybe pediades]|nr:hypothetical protein CPC08DRAFT_730157 [Agrocybe pediades]
MVVLGAILSFLDTGSPEGSGLKYIIITNYFDSLVDISGIKGLVPTLMVARLAASSSREIVTEVSSVSLPPELRGASHRIHGDNLESMHRNLSDQEDALLAVEVDGRDFQKI